MILYFLSLAPAYASTPCGCSEDTQLTIEPELGCLEWSNISYYCDYDTGDETEYFITNACPQPVVIDCREQPVDCTTKSTEDNVECGLALRIYSEINSDGLFELAVGESAKWDLGHTGGDFDWLVGSQNCIVTVGDEAYTMLVNTEYECDFEDHSKPAYGCNHLSKAPTPLLFTILAVFFARNRKSEHS